MLPSVPSFSVFSSPESPKRPLIPPDPPGSGDFSFPEKRSTIPALVVEEERASEDGVPARDDGEVRGLGIDEEIDPAEFPTLSRNHARLLASTSDVDGTEDYYHQATIAYPDGKTLMQYAKLVWEAHHDQQRASTYFQLAAEASPSDSDVLAALASFLWETGDGEEVEPEDLNQDSGYKLETSHSEVSPSCNGAESSSTSFTNEKRGGEVDDYFLNMIKGNPSDPLLLRNYSQFLYKSKQSLLSAMEYYSCAAHMNPTNVESLVMYVELLLQLPRDHDETSRLFERAINAAPEDCNILAAYTSFLWDTDGNEN